MATLVVALVGCGPTAVDTAKDGGSFAKLDADRRAVAIRLKGEVQKSPSSAPLRASLGKALLDARDPVGAALELNKARELGASDEETLPALVRALVASSRAQKAIQEFGSVSLKTPAARVALALALAEAYLMSGNHDRVRALVAGALGEEPDNAAANLLAARYLAVDGKTDDAWRIVEKVLEKTPQDPYALHLKGVLLRYFKKDYAAAIQVQRAAIGIIPDFVEAHTQILSMLYASGDIKAMQFQLEGLNRAAPNNFFGNLFRAQVESLIGNYVKAREIGQYLIKTRSEDIRVLMLVAQIEYKLGALQVADGYLRRAIQIAPNFPQARYLLATIKNRQGEPAQAIALIEGLLREDNPPTEVLVIAAESFLQLGSYPKAAGYFEKAATQRPADPQLQTAVALADMARGDFSLGIDKLEKIVASDSGIYANMALYSVYLKKGDHASAVRVAEQTIAKAPMDPLVHHLAGQAQLLVKNVNLARARQLKAIELDSGYFPAVASLAAMDLSENKVSDAAQRFEKLLEKDPNNPKALLALADCRKLQSAKPEVIEALLRKAALKNRNDRAPQLALALHLAETRNHRGAVLAAQDGLVAVPDDPGLLEVLARSHTALKEYQQAKSALAKLTVAIPKSAKPLVLLADIHQLQGDEAAAIAVLRRAIDLVPGAIDERRRLIYLLIGFKKFPEALAIAKETQRLFPKRGLGYLLEGAILSRQGDHKGALALYFEAKKRESTVATAMAIYTAMGMLKDPAGQQAFATNWLKDRPNDLDFLGFLGNDAASTGRWVDAETWYRRALKLNPTSATTLNNLAWALVALGKDESLKYAGEAMKLRPADVAVQDTYAHALLAGREFGAAAKQFEAILAKDSQRHASRLGLAKAAIGLGQRELAKRELEKLAWLGADFAKQSEVTTLLRGLQ